MAGRYRRCGGPGGGILIEACNLSHHDLLKGLEFLLGRVKSSSSSSSPWHSSSLPPPPHLPPSSSADRYIAQYQARRPPATAAMQPVQCNSITFGGCMHVCLYVHACTEMLVCVWMCLCARDARTRPLTFITDVWWAFFFSKWDILRKTTLLFLGVRCTRDKWDVKNFSCTHVCIFLKNMWEEYLIYIEHRWTQHNHSHLILM